MSHALLLTCVQSILSFVQGATLTSGERSAIRRGIRSAAAAAALFVASEGQALASTGCDQVNAGGFDTTAPSAGPIATISGFAVGDQVFFTVTEERANKNFRLTGVEGGSTVLLTVGLIHLTPVLVNYAVTGTNNDLALQTSVFGGTGPVTIAATCAPAVGPSQSEYSTHTVVKAFLQSRINGLLLNDPSGTSLLHRQEGQTSGTTNTGFLGFNTAASGAARALAPAEGMSALGLGSGLGGLASRFGDDDVDAIGTQTLQFRNRLSDVARSAAKARAEKEAALLSYSGGIQPAYSTISPFDLWVEGRYSGFNDDTAALDRDGHVGVLYVGADYRFMEHVLVGVLAEFDWSKDKSEVLQTDIAGNGWMAGPYLSARLSSNLYLDLRAAWGGSSNDLAVGATTAGFDTSRWLVKGELAGNWFHDGWRFTPSAELAYIEESQDAFTNSAGVFVPGQDVSLGRLTFGPEIGYRFLHADGTLIEPFGSFKGLWDFDNPNVAIIDGFVVGPGNFWGRLEGGLLMVAPEGWSVRGLASYDGIGADDFRGYTLQGEVNVPLN